MKRLIALLIAMSMLLSVPSMAEETDVIPEAVPAEQTETTEAVPEETAVTEVAEAPVETAAPETAEEPMEAEPEVTEAPEMVPTELPTEAPTQEPALEVTETPTQEPAELPTEAPTEAPTEVPPVETPAEATDIPGEPAWDESQCDHANEQCEQAPQCSLPGCVHIGQDANGLDVPVCELGMWLLERQDAQVSNPFLAQSVRSQEINLDRADVTLWRSGAYCVNGGRNRSSVTNPVQVTVAPNRMVVLDLTGTRIDVLTLGRNSLVYFITEGRNEIVRITAGEEASMNFVAGGVMKVGSVELPERQAGRITVLGGSVEASFAETKGRRMHGFDAAGITAVTVNGENYEADCADEQGKVWLWLPDAEAGKEWTAQVTDGVLAVAQTVSQNADSGVIHVPSGAQETARSGMTYVLTGPVSDDTVLTISESGVTVVLDRVESRNHLLLRASCEYELRVKHDSVLQNDGVVLEHAQSAADGVLVLDGGLGEGVRFLSGFFDVNAVPAGYTELGVNTPCSKLTIDGRSMPIVTMNGSLLAPAPAEGMIYSVAVADKTVEAVSTPTQMDVFRTDVPIIDATALRVFTVKGVGHYADTAIVAGSGDAAFESVQLQGREALRVNGVLNVYLTGDNGLVSEGGTICVADGAALGLSVESGRLLLRGQNDPSSIVLKGNVKVEPEPDLPHLCLMIRDKVGNPVPNTALTIRIGGKDYQYTTHYDGSLHVWGIKYEEGSDISATDGRNVYTAVVQNAHADVTTGLNIRNVKAVDQADGTVLVSFDCEGAKTVGVQYIAANQSRDLPDDYVEQAIRVEGTASPLVLRGVHAGQIVTLRVYAANAEGVVLDADSADGFQFSEIVRTAHRIPFSLEPGAANAVYTGKAYRIPFELPEGAQVAYEGQNLNNGMPWKVGCYKLLVTIPEGNRSFLPGTFEVPFEIEKIELGIEPGPNQEKYMGAEDPETFAWTVKGKLLAGDEIKGDLTREPGEEVGNYRFVTTGLTAPDYYEIKLVRDADVFTILPGSEGGGFIGVYEKLFPVKQEITRADKRSIFVVLNTRDTLTVSHSELGEVVRAMEDNQPAFFSPSLGWKRETDQVVLRLRMEPVINRDKGYATNPDGSIQWGGRYLRLGWVALRALNDKGIDAISIINAGASLTVPLTDFMSDELQEAVRACHATLTDVKFKLCVEPVAQLPEGMVISTPEASLVTDGWWMRITMMSGTEEYDLTSLFPGAFAAVDLEPVAELMTSIDLYNEETFGPQFAVLLGDEAQAAAAGSDYIQPFTPEEEKLAAYPSLLFTDRYVTAPLNGQSFVSCVMLPVEEELPVK